MKGYLIEEPEGELRHFTEALIDEFITECRDTVTKELRAAREGKHCLEPGDYSIENYYKGEPIK
ncbi:MAG: hypothetical protein IJ737_06230 [Ruminococcus sp.]|nr:hypothetical protein [Ruminococcus sp.]